MGKGAGATFCARRACLRAQASFEEGYINDADPSVLRFLIASREEVSAAQLRDDLLSMLVAGHETTGSVLTWTLYLLECNPEAMAKVRSLIWRLPVCGTCDVPLHALCSYVVPVLFHCLPQRCNGC